MLSPVVRQLVADYGIDPASVAGTGKGGRITRADVLGFIDRRAAGGAPGQTRRTPAGSAAVGQTAEAPTAPAGAAAPASYPAVRDQRDEVVPFTNIRRLTAEHMVRSKATSAHTLVVIEADYEGIERVRAAHKDRFREEEGIGLTYLPFIARAVVETLRDYPHLNASVGDDALVVHRDVHLGIAVDLDQRGLIVPVVQERRRSVAARASPAPWPISPSGPERASSPPTTSWAGPSRSPTRARSARSSRRRSSTSPRWPSSRPTASSAARSW